MEISISETPVLTLLVALVPAVIALLVRYLPGAWETMRATGFRRKRWNAPVDRDP